jgi:tetratricopeptide (TPR) repeat protein
MEKCKVCAGISGNIPHSVSACTNKVCTDCSNILKIQKCSQCYYKIRKSSSKKSIFDLVPLTDGILNRKEHDKFIHETKILKKSTQLDNTSIQVATFLILSYDKAIRASKFDYFAYTNKGICLNSLKLYEEAIKCFDKAIDINSAYALAYQKRGTFKVHFLKIISIKYLKFDLCLKEMLFLT